MKELFSKPYLKAYSGLSVNLSAAYFILAFLGPNISFPKTLLDFTTLLSNIGLGIIFLLITILLERRLEYG